MLEKQENTNIESNIEEGFKAEYYDSIPQIKQGQLLTGKIVEIQDEIVFVDIGGKSEGIVKSAEFKVAPQKGDSIEVIVESLEDENNNVILSKKKADNFLAKKRIKEAFDNGDFPEGRILKEIKGGYQVDVLGLSVFLPFSQVYQSKVENLLERVYILKFKVMKCDLAKNNIVISNRAYEEIEKQKQNENFFSKNIEGNVLSGKIVKIFNYGAIVELSPGVNGFLHLKDLSWSFVKSFKDFSLKEGDTLKVKILKMDTENKKIQLGLKQLDKDPFTVFLSKYKEGDQVKGKVTRLIPYGAFVELSPSVIGFIPNEEISWTSKISNPSKFLKEGYLVKVKILSINEEKRKINLSLRQIMDDPWLSIQEKYPKGIKVVGKVKVVLKQNVFLIINNDVEGFLNAKNIDWDKNYQDLKNENVLSKNQKIDLMVLDYDFEKKLLITSMKHLKEDPFKNFMSKYPKGSMIESKISEILEDRLVVSLVDEEFKDLTGIVSKYDLGLKETAKINEEFEVGSSITLVLKYVDFAKKQVVLSKKAYQHKVEKEEIKKYVNKDNSNSNKVTLKDILNFKGIKM